ncbi:MAG TPA: metallophosphatase [Saprospiraceae bacterium]|nr:metallophosphatase [Saprospiraceae bacterium]
MKRRKFVQQIGVGTALMSTGLPVNLWGSSKAETVKLTILHTNDIHSRIEPFDQGRNAGRGGAARRAAMIQQIRQEEEHVLLLDAGDIFQGTPYFNFFAGELEFKLMSEMQYDAATIGNHDFDAGIEGLVKQLPHANFPFLVCNYDFSDTLMAGKTKPYQIFEKGPLKIGVFGLGIELQGLVPKVLYKNTRYQNPITKANEVATILKEEEKCDYVICLSHLGYRYRDQTVSDVKLGEYSRHVDMIIGGHTHTFMDEPLVVRNRQGEPVLINQAGWGGILLGRLDVLFERNQKNKCIGCQNIAVGAARI